MKSTVFTLWDVFTNHEEYWSACENSCAISFVALNWGKKSSNIIMGHYGFREVFYKLKYGVWRQADLFQNVVIVFLILHYAVPSLSTICSNIYQLWVTHPESNTHSQKSGKLCHFFSMNMLHTQNIVRTELGCKHTVCLCCFTAPMLLPSFLVPPTDLMD